MCVCVCVFVAVLVVSGVYVFFLLPLSVPPGFVAAAGCGERREFGSAVFGAEGLGARASVL